MKNKNNGIAILGFALLCLLPRVSALTVTQDYSTTVVRDGAAGFYGFSFAGTFAKPDSGLDLSSVTLSFTDTLAFDHRPFNYGITEPNYTPDVLFSSLYEVHGFATLGVAGAHATGTPYSLAGREYGPTFSGTVVSSSTHSWSSPAEISAFRSIYTPLVAIIGTDYIQTAPGTISYTDTIRVSMSYQYSANTPGVPDHGSTALMLAFSIMVLAWRTPFNPPSK